MTEQKYQVNGMSCGHCADRITKEVSAVPGVSRVVVDLGANAVTVGGAPLDDGLIREAIAEAGYGVTDAP
ncbi:heavy-metal-associated domain-containing protein [Streptomyces sp. NPDC002209]|uniref:heavy-metal-associated domain-containing protein n=1 Tax=Streptomyces sp. NPDC002209 TaxID=3364638 RepID=UPI0036B98220